MELDTSWTDNHPVEKITTKGTDTYRHVKVSNNQSDVQFDNNRLAASRTESNNKLDTFKYLVNARVAIVQELLSVVNTGIKAYVEIQKSREETRRIQIQADAYIHGRKEDTRQIQIQAEQETARYVAEMKYKLENKRMELQADLQKFDKELNDKRDVREFDRAKWRDNFDAVNRDLERFRRQADELWQDFRASGYENETIWKTLNTVNEQIMICHSELMKL